MPHVFRPVSPSFLATLRACAWESPERLTLPTEPPIALHVCVGESGAWALGMAPRVARSMSRATFDMLGQAVAMPDGAIDLGGGWTMALLDIGDGWVTPGEVPPPPPPPR